jgi:hypothetical protein
MTPEASKIRDRLRRAEQELEAAKGAVAHLEATCSHTFTPPVRDDLVRPGYYDTPPWAHPGRGPENHQVYVPEQRTPRWCRTCVACGKVQHTTQTDEHVTHTPRF